MEAREEYKKRTNAVQGEGKRAFASAWKFPSAYEEELKHWYKQKKKSIKIFCNRKKRFLQTKTYEKMVRKIAENLQDDERPHIDGGK